MSQTNVGRMKKWLWILPVIVIVAVFLLLHRHHTRPSEVFLRRLPPEQALSMRSFQNNTPSLITFSNHTAKELHLVWLDYQGRRQDYGIIPPNGSVFQATYVWYPWLCVDDDGNSVALFLSQPGRCVADIK